jgi:hypothetical protein
VADVCKFVVPMAMILDKHDRQSSTGTERMSYVSSIVLKIFNTCRGEKLDQAVVRYVCKSLNAKLGIVS